MWEVWKEIGERFGNFPNAPCRFDLKTEQEKQICFESWKLRQVMEVFLAGYSTKTPKKGGQTCNRGQRERDAKAQGNTHVVQGITGDQDHALQQYPQHLGQILDS